MGVAVGVDSWLSLCPMMICRVLACVSRADACRGCAYVCVCSSSSCSCGVCVRSLAWRGARPWHRQ